jgi:hypothetical protein
MVDVCGNGIPPGFAHAGEAVGASYTPSAIDMTEDGSQASRRQVVDAAFARHGVRSSRHGVIACGCNILPASCMPVEVLAIWPVFTSLLPDLVREVPTSLNEDQQEAQSARHLSCR